MVREYETEELRQKIFEGNERFYLVDTLPRQSYVNRHLPGAVNLPLEHVERDAATCLPDQDAEIITYCSGPR